MIPLAKAWILFYENWQKSKTNKGIVDVYFFAFRNKKNEFKEATRNDKMDQFILF